MAEQLVEVERLALHELQFRHYLKKLRERKVNSGECAAQVKCPEGNKDKDIDSPSFDCCVSSSVCVYVCKYGLPMWCHYSTDCSLSENA